MQYRRVFGPIHKITTSSSQVFIGRPFLRSVLQPESCLTHTRQEIDMYEQRPNSRHAPNCDFVPGYAYYSGIGYGLAGQLVNLIEWFLGLRK